MIGRTISEHVSAWPPRRHHVEVQSTLLPPLRKHLDTFSKRSKVPPMPSGLHALSISQYDITCLRVQRHFCPTTEHLPQGTTRRSRHSVQHLVGKSNIDNPKLDVGAWELAPFSSRRLRPHGPSLYQSQSESRCHRSPTALLEE